MNKEYKRHKLALCSLSALKDLIFEWDISFCKSLILTYIVDRVFGNYESSGEHEMKAATKSKGYEEKYKGDLIRDSTEKLDKK